MIAALENSMQRLMESDELAQDVEWLVRWGMGELPAIDVDTLFEEQTFMKWI